MISSYVGLIYTYTYIYTLGLGTRLRQKGEEKKRQRGHESIFMVRGEFCGVNWMPFSAVTVATWSAFPVAKKVALLQSVLIAFILPMHGYNHTAG